MSNLDLKSKQLFPVIPLSWEKTTAPELSITLPMDVKLKVTEEAIQIHAERKGSLAADEELDLQFQRGEIVGVDIVLMPDLPDGTDWEWVRGDAFSTAIIRLRDPFEVVEFFENTFSSHKSYWLKALAKGLREKLGIEPTVAQGTRSAGSV